LKDIQKLQVRTSALEDLVSGPSANANGQGTAAKRFRSAPASSDHRKERSCAVVTGCPPATRRKDIQEFVNRKLKESEEWKHLESFAPNVRGTVALVRMSSVDAVHSFARTWNAKGFDFKGSILRCRAERPPEKRKSNAKVYLMHEFLVNIFKGKVFDADYRRGSVWSDDGGLVRWNVTSESFEWDQDMISKSALNIDTSKATQHTERR
jgi:hypothetical protein